MSTLSADLNTKSVSATSLPKATWNSAKKVVASIGKVIVVASEVVYEARQEEIRLRAHYRL